MLNLGNISKVSMAVEELSLIELEFVGDCNDELSRIIKKYVDAHEGVALRDLLKFLYQSVLGAHHIFDMMEENGIKKWIEKNLDDAEPSDNPLTEELYGKKWVRIDLGSFKKKHGNNSEKLFEIFLKGKEEKRGSMDEFLSLQDELTQLVKNGKIKPLSHSSLGDLVECFIVNYKQKGYPPLHHSRLYVKKNPTYLVASSKAAKDIQRNI